MQIRTDGLYGEASHPHRGKEQRCHEKYFREAPEGTFLVGKMDGRGGGWGAQAVFSIVFSINAAARSGIMIS